MKEFNEDGMMIRAKFTNAKKVSKGLDIDHLNINFVWPFYFQTQKDGIVLHMNYKLRAPLPMQMSKEDSEAAEKEGSSLEFLSRFGYLVGIGFMIF